MDAMGEKHVIYVRTLGGFTIKAGTRAITDSSNQSKKPWLLLEYLVIFQKKPISPSELIRIIWADDPGINPNSSLKTLIFRTRKLLGPLGISPQKLLVQKGGSYAWTQEYTTVIDIDEFEDICNKVLGQPLEDEEALSLCYQGLSLYKGDFLPKSEYEPWVIPIAAYYHSQYQKLVHKTIELLVKKQAYAKITSICEGAVRIEPFDETLCYHLVHSLFKDGHTSQALEEYKHTMNLFYNEFSISPSNDFKNLYRIIWNEAQGININLDSIQDALQEEGSKGAFYCEYSVFHDLFQLGRRAIERTGDSIYLCLLTITDTEKATPKLPFLTKAMKHLNTAVSTSLRCSDAYTRYSVCQYLILLPTITSEQAETVLNRICVSFRKLYNRKDLMVNYSLQPVLPRKRST